MALTHITAGWVIDGRGGPIVENAIVSIEDGIVRDVRRVEPPAGGVPEDTHPNILDLSDCTLMPGLIDAHVHLSMSGSSNPSVREQQLLATYPEKKPVIRHHLNDHFISGVVAVRDGGDRDGCVGRFLLDDVPSPLPGVIVRQPGRAWHARGRYGTLIGRPPEGAMTLAGAIGACVDCVDHVKIVNSGLNSLKTFGHQTAPQFDVKMLKTAVNRAAGMGLTVMVHANGERPVRESLEGGCHSIEHGFFMGADNLKRMADLQTVWVPTAVTMNAYVGLAKPGSIEASVARKNLDHQLEQIALARTLGVPVALGTDAGSPGVHHGAAVKEEFGLLLQSGYSVAEAVRCATAAAGPLLFGGSPAGGLLVGRPARFIAVKGRPQQLPESLADIFCVYLGGELTYMKDQRAGE